jgi:hypothetical protein
MKAGKNRAVGGMKARFVAATDSFVERRVETAE